MQGLYGVDAPVACSLICTAPVGFSTLAVKVLFNIAALKRILKALLFHRAFLDCFLFLSHYLFSYLAVINVLPGYTSIFNLVNYSGHFL